LCHNEAFVNVGRLKRTYMAQAALEIRAWLRGNKRIIVPDDWLEACIDWVQSENEVRES
jgi:hypothetical protein